ncbi:hypothetical protein JL720_4841 [Aureococcus anophagefferens]|nr:hypothetical protein JL720_4841 [Aureococcus anophagefferens]
MVTTRNADKRRPSAPPPAAKSRVPKPPARPTRRCVEKKKRSDKEKLQSQAKGRAAKKERAASLVSAANARKSEKDNASNTRTVDLDLPAPRLEVGCVGVGDAALYAHMKARGQGTIRLPGIQVQQEWATQLASGRKAIEVRPYRLDPSRRAKPHWIIKTTGQLEDARVVGVVKFREDRPYVYTSAAQLEHHKDLALVGAAYFESARKTPYGWPVEWAAELFCDTAIDVPANKGQSGMVADFPGDVNDNDVLALREDVNVDDDDDDPAPPPSPEPLLPLPPPPRDDDSPAPPPAILAQFVARPVVPKRGLRPSEQQKPKKQKTPKTEQLFSPPQFQQQLLSSAPPQLQQLSPPPPPPEQLFSAPPPRRFFSAPPPRLQPSPPELQQQLFSPPEQLQQLQQQPSPSPPPPPEQLFSAPPPPRQLFSPARLQQQPSPPELQQQRLAAGAAPAAPYHALATDDDPNLTEQQLHGLAARVTCERLRQNASSTKRMTHHRRAEPDVTFLTASTDQGDSSTKPPAPTNPAAWGRAERDFHEFVADDVRRATERRCEIQKYLDRWGRRRPIGLATIDGDWAIQYLPDKLNALRRPAGGERPGHAAAGYVLPYESYAVELDDGGPPVAVVLRDALTPLARRGLLLVMRWHSQFAAGEAKSASGVFPEHPVGSFDAQSLAHCYKTVEIRKALFSYILDHREVRLAPVLAAKGHSVYTNRAGKNVTWKPFRRYLDRQGLALSELKGSCDCVQALLRCVEDRARRVLALMGHDVAEGAEIYKACCTILQYAMSQVAVHRDKKDKVPTCLLGGTANPNAPYVAGELVLITGAILVDYKLGDMVFLSGSKVLHAVCPLCRPPNPADDDDDDDDADAGPASRFDDLPIRFTMAIFAHVTPTTPPEPGTPLYDADPALPAGSRRTRVAVVRAKVDAVVSEYTAASRRRSPASAQYAPLTCVCAASSPSGATSWSQVVPFTGHRVPPGQQ